MPSEFINYESVRTWLYGLRNRGSSYGIDRMREFVEILGHPQLTFPCIHVAGTNGKGSVSAMLERIYRGSGLRVGLFTSPHLVHQGERIQVDRCRLSEDEILQYTNELLPHANQIAQRDPDNHPTFFEWMTAMAFVHFKRSKVDLAILETGLGGRLDSTNVVQPQASVITSIGLDHTEILGETLGEIAKEKAGIIKRGRPVILGRMPEEASRVIKRIAKQKGSIVHSVEENFARRDLPCTNLFGTVQEWNAAIAVTTCEALGEQFPVSSEVIEASLQDVSWAGRWSELRAGDRTIIFDAAHNADALESLCENLSSLQHPPYVVAGFTGSADRAKALLPVLEAKATEVVVVQPTHDRGLHPSQLGIKSKASIQELFPANSVCTLGPSDSTVVVTGSIYLVAEIYERLLYKTSRGHQLLQD